MGILITSYRNDVITYVYCVVGYTYYTIHSNFIANIDLRQSCISCLKKFYILLIKFYTKCDYKIIKLLNNNLNSNFKLQKCVVHVSNDVVETLKENFVVKLKFHLL